MPISWSPSFIYCKHLIYIIIQRFFINTNPGGHSFFAPPPFRFISVQDLEYCSQGGWGKQHLNLNSNSCFELRNFKNSQSNFLTSSSLFPLQIELTKENKLAKNLYFLFFQRIKVFATNSDFPIPTYCCNPMS